MGRRRSSGRPAPGEATSVCLARTLKQISRRAPRRPPQLHITANALRSVQTQTFDGWLTLKILTRDLGGEGCASCPSVPGALTAGWAETKGARSPPVGSSLMDLATSNGAGPYWSSVVPPLPSPSPPSRPFPFEPSLRPLVPRSDGPTSQTSQLEASSARGQDGRGNPTALEATQGQI